MRNVLAMVYFLLALVGCNEWGGTTTVTRSSDDGADVLYSKTRVMAGVARFECITSVSGRCHYVLFPRDCASPAAPADACTAQAVEHFTMAVGATREIVGLPSGFGLCVSHEDKPVTPGCAPLQDVSGPGGARGSS